MISVDEYKRRVDYNTQVLHDTINRNENLLHILDKVYTYDKTPNSVHFSLLCPKWADIIPAAFLGHLAIIDEKTGADGIRYCDEKQEFIETEYKVTTFHSEKLAVGVKGGMSIGYGKKPTGISSYISATYTIHSDGNLNTKNRETYLCITDANCTTHDFIDFYKLEGDKALSALVRSDKKKRQISFGHFRNDGERVQTVAPVVTWDLFEADQIRKKHPVASERLLWEYKHTNLIKQVNSVWEKLSQGNA